MSEKPVKPIPIAGSWIQNVNERAILYVSEVDEVKERIRIKRFARYSAEGPEFGGRTTWISYETYQRGTRYMPREAPVNADNLPERITREQAQEALELEGWSKEQASFSVDNAMWQVDDLIGRPSAILRAYLGKSAPAVTHEPVPPTLDRDGAIRMLQALGANSEAIEEILRDPRKALATARAEPAPDDLESIAAPTLAILAAHVAHLDAHAPAVTPPDGMPAMATLTREQAEERLRQYVADDRAIEVLLRRPGPCSQVSSPPIAAILLAYERGQSASKLVNLLDGPDPNDVPAAQPTIADVLAAIEALRAEVRADRKPLLDAVDRVLGNHGPYGSESDVVEVHLDAFKALRVARAKV